MTAYSTDRLTTSSPIATKASLRRRAVGVPTVGSQRMSDRRPASASAALGGALTRSIERAIAQFVDANPAQLYRGGA